ncbi:pnp [Acrasis kona]|uniref:Pnp n=1 Tax=Acrasis kona TaxID=1008807 RepID=A0AAW2ZCW2_9EUKA
MRFKSIIPLVSYTNYIPRRYTTVVTTTTSSTPATTDEPLIPGGTTSTTFTTTISIQHDMSRPSTTTTITKIEPLFGDEVQDEGPIKITTDINTTISVDPEANAVNDVVLGDYDLDHTKFH